MFSLTSSVWQVGATHGRIVWQVLILAHCDTCNFGGAANDQVWSWQTQNKIDGSQDKAHNCFNPLELRCIDLVTVSTWSLIFLLLTCTYSQYSIKFLNSARVNKSLFLSLIILKFHLKSWTNRQNKNFDFIFEFEIWKVQQTKTAKIKIVEMKKLFRVTYWI